MGIPHSLFEEQLEALKTAKGVKDDTDLTAADLKELVAQYKNVYIEAKGEQFPTGTSLSSTFPLSSRCGHKFESLMQIQVGSCIWR